MKPLAIAR